MLKGRYSFVNLTRILDSDDFFNKQILDSVLPFQQVCELENVLRRTNNLLDIGFGGGFPILPLAFAFPEINFYGMEGRSRKVEAVKGIAKELGLANVKLKTGRIEDYLVNKNILITFKAVGSVKDCLMNIHLPPSIDEVSAVFYKGPSFEQEEGSDVAKIPDWNLQNKFEIEIPGTSKRQIVLLSSIKRTDTKRQTTRNRQQDLFPFAE